MTDARGVAVSTATATATATSVLWQTEKTGQDGTRLIYATAELISTDQGRNRRVGGVCYLVLVLTLNSDFNFAFTCSFDVDVDLR